MPQFRFLQPDEWHKLKHILEPGEELPNPSNYIAAVGEENGEVVAVQFLGFIPHGGPLWIAPKFRGTGIWRPLNDLMETALRKIPGAGYLMFPSNPKAEGVCKKLGLKRMPWSVYRRVF